MAASSAGRKGTAVRHNCSVNGSEKDFEWGDSDGSMEVRKRMENLQGKAGQM